MSTNNIFKKIIVLVAVLISMNFSLSSVSAEEKQQPAINGEYGATIDANSGELLYDKEAKTKGFPASVTKVLTALLLVENIEEDETITLSETCINHDRSNSQILFKPGEQLERDVALFTMMTLSANDLACAVGEHISGSEEEFGKLMTERAKEIGALNSQFMNASGLHNPEHYTTAYDMALIGREAIKHEIVLKAMGTKNYTVNTNLQKGVEVENPSKIHDDPEALGGKTGYTNEARNTLMKIDEKNGIRVINVILGNNSLVNKYNMYDDIKNMSNYSIEQLEKQIVLDKTKWTKKLTILGKEVLVKPKESINVTKKKEEKVDYKIKFVQDKLVDSKLYLKGIKTGQKLGVIEVSKNQEIIKTVDVVSTENVHFEKPKEVFVPYWLKVLLALVIPIGIYVSYVVLYNQKNIGKKRNQ